MAQPSPTPVVDIVDRQPSVTPREPVAPPPPVGVYRAEVEQWRPYVAAYPWSVEVVLCIINRESGGTATAINPSSGTRGLMQIRPSSHAERIARMGLTIDDLLDGPTNIAVAADIYWNNADGTPAKAPGFWAWDGSPGCWS